MISPHSMRPFSQSPQPKLLRWTRSPELYSRQPIELLKMARFPGSTTWSTADKDAAGIPIEKCAGTETSVHIGCSSDDYRMMYVKDTGRPIRHAATGMAISMLANKVSWFYDITGPSITLDTACSASLNALHLSCESLRSGDSSMVSVCQHLRST